MSTPDLLLLVLLLLALLPGGALDLGSVAVSDQAVDGLESLHSLGGLVDESESGASATTELGLDTEDGNLLLAGLVQLGEAITELILGDVGPVGVQDVNDHLLAAKERVGDELASTQDDVRISHIDVFWESRIYL